MDKLKIGELFNMLKPRLIGLITGHTIDLAESGTVIPAADVTMTDAFQDFGSVTISVASAGTIHVTAKVEHECTAWTNNQWEWSQLLVDGVVVDTAVYGARGVNIMEHTLTWVGAIAAGSRVVKVQVRKDNNTYNTVIARKVRSQIAWMLFS